LPKKNRNVTTSLFLIARANRKRKSMARNNQRNHLITVVIASFFWPKKSGA
jgi:hypothetical protein